jgi:hypothetical protein
VDDTNNTPTKDNCDQPGSFGMEDCLKQKGKNDDNQVQNVPAVFEKLNAQRNNKEG